MLMWSHNSLVAWVFEIEQRPVEGLSKTDCEQAVNHFKEEHGAGRALKMLLRKTPRIPLHRYGHIEENAASGGAHRLTLREKIIELILNVATSS